MISVKCTTVTSKAMVVVSPTLSSSVSERCRRLLTSNKTPSLMPRILSTLLHAYIPRTCPGRVIGTDIVFQGLVRISDHKRLVLGAFALYEYDLPAVRVLRRRYRYRFCSPRRAPSPCHSRHLLTLCHYYIVGCFFLVYS